jgi:hypothetical protein
MTVLSTLSMQMTPLPILQAPGLAEIGHPSVEFGQGKFVPCAAALLSSAANYSFFQ